MWCYIQTRNSEKRSYNTAATIMKIIRHAQSPKERKDRGENNNAG